MENNNPWRQVVFAEQCDLCPCCGEAWCAQCEDHYAECSCPGPTQDNMEYRTIDGVLHAREMHP